MEETSREKEQSGRTEVIGEPVESKKVSESASSSQGMGQHSDAAKALLHLNNVDYPLPPRPNSQWLHQQYSRPFNEMMTPTTMPIMLMQNQTPYGMSASATQSIQGSSGLNIQNRRAAEAQFQIASAIHAMNNPGSGLERGQKKKRKKANPNNPINRPDQEMDRGEGNDSATHSKDPEADLPHQTHLQHFQLPPTLPQYQSPSVPHLQAPQISSAGAPFFLPGTAFTNGDANFGIPGSGGTLLTSNGMLQSAAYGGSPGMFQNVMSHFALGVGASGLFASLPVGVANGVSAAGSQLPNGAKPVLPGQSGSELGGSGGGDKGKSSKLDAKGGRKQRFYKSLSCNYWNSVEEQDAEEGESDEGNMDITTPWRCEVCNIFFTSAQALGGHRINSTDHKQRCEKLRRGDTASLPGTPRLSLHVYSNEETTDRGKRTRLPPMAQMAGFERVLLGFPSDVRKALARIQSPAAYFSSCSLDVFKRHEKFGSLGDLIISKYFTSSSDTFESMMQNPRGIPEVAHAGFGSEMSDELHNELKIFARMLLTKKKFLDINRRAVSKRIKGIRKAGGERLKEFNQKKARHASMATNLNSQDTRRLMSAPPHVTTEVGDPALSTQSTGSASQQSEGMEPVTVQPEPQAMQTESEDARQTEAQRLASTSAQSPAVL